MEQYKKAFWKKKKKRKFKQSEVLKLDKLPLKKPKLSKYILHIKKVCRPGPAMFWVDSGLKISQVHTE